MDRADVERLTRVWQQRLHLTSWDIKIAWVTKWAQAGDAIAEVTNESMYDEAWIDYDTKLLEKSDAAVEQTIIHELLHLVDRNRTAMVAEIEGSLPAAVWRYFQKVEYLQTEGVVNRLATILYEVTRPAEPAPAQAGAPAVV